MNKRLLIPLLLIPLLLVAMIFIPIKTETLPASCFNYSIPERLDLIQGETINKARKINNQSHRNLPNAGVCAFDEKTVKLYIL